MKVIGNFAALGATKARRGHILLLFSGGLDSCHTLSLLKEAGWRVTALYVGFGEKPPETLSVAEDVADTVLHVDAEQVFCDEFLACGIRCQAIYYGGMPLSSTFTRPLIAGLAVEHARRLGVEVIASNVTAFQNSFFRFAKSIEILAPEMSLFSPSIGSYIDRQAKVQQLISVFKPFFLNVARGTYSVDENVWCRVVENGDIEHPDRTLPIGDIRMQPWQGGEVHIEIKFSGGTPVAVGGEEMPLSRLVHLLNKRFEGHPDSFFYGLEGNVFGVKNPEPRISMAARLIHEGSLFLSQAILSTLELQLREELSRRFALAAIEGGWFSSHAAALRAALEVTARPLSGLVSWRIDERSTDPARIVPAASSKIGSHLPHFTTSVEQFGITEKVVFDVMREHTYA